MNFSFTKFKDLLWYLEYLGKQFGTITETTNILQFKFGFKFGMNAKSEFICIFVTTSKQKFIFDTLLGTESLRVVCFILVITFLI